MDYFAGLDISMDETHVCVLDRKGTVVRESKAVSAHKRAVSLFERYAKAGDNIKLKDWAKRRFRTFSIILRWRIC
jgi:hypothetical protein